MTGATADASRFKELVRPGQLRLPLYAADEITRDALTGNYTVDPDGPDGMASSLVELTPGQAKVTLASP